MTKIVNAPELKSRLAAQGIMIDTNSPADFARFIREDHALWGKVIKEAGIKANDDAGRPASPVQQSLWEATPSPRCCARSTFRTWR